METGIRRFVAARSALSQMSDRDWSDEDDFGASVVRENYSENIRTYTVKVPATAIRESLTSTDLYVIGNWHASLKGWARSEEFLPETLVLALLSISAVSHWESIPRTLQDSATKEWVAALTSKRMVRRHNSSIVFWQTATQKSRQIVLSEALVSLESAGRQDASDIVERLTELDQLIREESAGAGLSEGSIKSFVRFMCDNTSIRRPYISASPDNELYATWKGPSPRRLSVRFLDRDAKFVLMIPNVRHDLQQTILSGLTTVDTLIDTVAPHGALTWLQQ